MSYQPFLKTNVLYSTMIVSPNLRWLFIRKIYFIVAIQLLLSAVVGAFIVSHHSVATFLTTTSGGIACYILILFTPFITLGPLSCYYQSHPLNYLLLGIFTIAIAFSIGLSCAFTSGEVILEAVILTAGVVVSLTLYTFWAAKRGHDFNFLGPFLFGALSELIVFSFIQTFFPMVKISVMTYGGLSAIVFCGYIIYDTDELIKRYTYDEYIWVAAALYIDIIKIFFDLVRILKPANRKKD